MLLRDFIKKINENFADLVPAIKVFGLAQLVERTAGTERETLPGVVELGGEVKYVGPDDVDSVRIYHRNTSIVTSRSTQQKGYGDEHADIVNTYQMLMIVYVNHKLSKLFPEELFLLLQANIPDAIKFSPYKKILLSTGNVIFNSQTVFNQEYIGASFKLPPEHNLFQINYNIETTFQKSCFDKCPEDLK